MTEFKVGDRVRLTGSLWEPEYEMGDATVTIDGVDGEGAYFNKLEYGPLYVYTDNSYLDNDWGGELVTEDDVVNNPQHYKTDSGLEVIEVIEAFDLDRYLSPATKYILRAGKKSPETEIQDLEKSVWYIQRKIERLKNVSSK